MSAPIQARRLAWEIARGVCAAGIVFGIYLATRNTAGWAVVVGSFFALCYSWTEVDNRKTLLLRTRRLLRKRQLDRWDLVDVVPDYVRTHLHSDVDDEEPQYKEYWKEEEEFLESLELITRGEKPLFLVTPAEDNVVVKVNHVWVSNLLQPFMVAVPEKREVNNLPPPPMKES